MFFPLIRDGRHCGWHSALRLLSLVRYRRELAGLSFSTFDSPLVGSVPSCCWCFTLRCLFSLALRYWLTLLLHTPLFHIQTFGTIDIICRVKRLVSQQSPTRANTSQLNLYRNAVDRLLVMRALGGAITSPCSNDTESRRPTLTMFGLSPHLLVNCWMLLDSPILLTALSGRLLVVFCVYTWLVQLRL